MIYIINTMILKNLATQVLWGSEISRIQEFFSLQIMSMIRGLTRLHHFYAVYHRRHCSYKATICKIKIPKIRYLSLFLCIILNVHLSNSDLFVSFDNMFVSQLSEGLKTCSSLTSLLIDNSSNEKLVVESMEPVLLHILKGFLLQVIM